MAVTTVSRSCLSQCTCRSSILIGSNCTTSSWSSIPGRILGPYMYTERLTRAQHDVCLTSSMGDVSGDVRACQLACATGDAARTRKLLKDSSDAYALANSHDANGTTALMRAAYCRADGAAACVAALLEAGADPLQRDKRGGDALRWATNNRGIGREAEAGKNVRKLLTAALESSSCGTAPAPPTAQTMDLEGGGMRSRPCIVSGSSIQRNTQCEEIYEPLTSRHKSRTSAREPACA